MDIIFEIGDWLPFWYKEYEFCSAMKIYLNLTKHLKYIILKIHDWAILLETSEMSFHLLLNVIEQENSEFQLFLF